MPVDEETLLELFKEEDVELPKHPGTFDAMKVKYGNTKDPVKRQALLSEKMAAHNVALASWDDDCKQAREDAWVKFKSKATLGATTGKVMAIGYGIRAGTEVRLFLDVQTADERNVLLRLWKLVTLVRKRNHKLVSFNGHRFDLPFCVHRSWAYEDVTPINLLTKYNNYDECCTDVYEVWKQGNYQAHIKLDHLARMMGVRRKLEGMTGGQFWQVYGEDQDKALDYLAHDIWCLADVSARMQTG
jgi:predicted PolB exonuclease-like 3'-5' exonuclease